MALLYDSYSEYCYFFNKLEVRHFTENLGKKWGWDVVKVRASLPALGLNLGHLTWGDS